ncbi:alpha/beta-hydrolase N-terminal domain-containing protein [Streptomyces sp. INA 01156]
MICGITAAIGYGLGVLAACVWRAFADREPGLRDAGPGPPSSSARRSFSVSSSGSGSTGSTRSAWLMGVTDYSVPLAVASPFIAVLVFCLLLLTGRGVRGIYRRLSDLLKRWVGARAARAVGWILVTGLAYLIVTSLLLDGCVALANQAFSVRNTTTQEGVHQPTTSLRSGGPGSLVPWDSLGLQGRGFTGTAPRRRTSRASPTVLRRNRSAPTPDWRRRAAPSPVPRWRSPT